MVRVGQRRTLAARKAGLTSVPVYVRPASDGDDTAYLVARVTEQIVENDHSRELGHAQRARGIQQLLDAGVSTTKVAQIHRTKLTAGSVFSAAVSRLYAHRMFLRAS